MRGSIFCHLILRDYCDFDIKAEKDNIRKMKCLQWFLSGGILPWHA